VPLLLRPGRLLLCRRAGLLWLLPLRLLWRCRRLNGRRALLRYERAIAGRRAGLLVLLRRRLLYRWLALPLRLLYRLAGLWGWLALPLRLLCVLLRRGLLHDGLLALPLRLALRLCRRSGRWPLLLWGWLALPLRLLAVLCRRAGLRVGRLLHRWCLLVLLLLCWLALPLRLLGLLHRGLLYGLLARVRARHHGVARGRHRDEMTNIDSSILAALLFTRLGSDECKVDLATRPEATAGLRYRTLELAEHRAGCAAVLFDMDDAHTVIEVSVIALVSLDSCKNLHLLVTVIPEQRGSLVEVTLLRLYCILQHGAAAPAWLLWA
jgi:hypothetical protein